MPSFKKYQIQDLLQKEMQCSCGRIHYVDIKDIIIRKGAINIIPDMLVKYHCKKLFLVADENTYEAAGKEVERLLKKKSFDLTTHVFRRETELVPDENAVGEFILHIPKDTDMILAVGSGTINDLSKFVSHQLSIPYMIVTTAPSMDGFSSVTTALIVDNLKTTYEVTPPKAIIADINILKRAPLNMISAGFGDIIGKYTSLCDWELSRTINEEYYCNDVADLVRNSIEKCTSHIKGIKIGKI